MLERRIRVEPFEFLNYISLEITKEINAHGRAKIIGMVSVENAQKYFAAHKPKSNAKIIAIDENSNEQILFNGLISDFSLQNTGEVYLLHLKLVAYSIHMDTVKHLRTFQNTAMTYSNVADLMTADSGIGNILFSQYGAHSIDKLFVQYEETDWEFAKRLASRLNTVVVSDFLLGMPYISIGIPKKTDQANFDSASHTLGFEQKESFYSNNYNPLYYVVNSREAFEIGTPTTFCDKPMLVAKVETSLVGSQLEHTYTLRPEGGFITHEYYNQNLIGCSIVGNIEDVRKDLVKIKVQGDVKQSGYMWFSYATVYSSPDNTGWYFMPEINDEVRLHFPTEREWEGYVISSVHEGGRADADTKSIRTKWGKEIVFTPSSIYINNGAGSNILLDDEEGIRIATTKTIDIVAEKDITMDATGKIDIVADKGVTIAQGDSIITVDDVIDISAEYVRVE